MTTVTLQRYIKLMPPYLMEVFVRSKIAWGGGLAIIAVGIIEHATGRSLSGFWYTVALLAAVIGAQFWHGLIQFEKMRPRFEVRPLEQHFWGLKERGTSGTGYYFEVFNPSVSESLECVRAELISVEPEPSSLNGILPFPLHIRHLNYCIAETFINPRCSRRFDFATGPDHNTAPQRLIIIPGIIGGDRGYIANGVQVPFDRYRLRIRVSARHCASKDLSYDLWVDEHDFLRCVEHQIGLKD